MDVSRESFPAFLRRTWRIWTGLVVVYSILAANLPPMDDEVYYWSWSKTPQFSYFDHPGMVAWLIWLSTRIFGDTVLGMRFPACCCVTFTFAVVAYLVRRTGRDTTLLRSVAKVNPLLVGLAVTPLCTFGAILITPDAPLLAAWSAYLLWLAAIQERLEERSATKWNWLWWLGGGVLLGLGGLSKYTMIIAVPAGFVAFLLSGIPWRRWFAGYLFHGVISAVVASPIFLYNWQHNFEPLQFQWRHAMHDAPASLQSFGEFWAVQILLFGTLPLFLVPWTVRHFHELRLSPRLRVCSCLYVFPLLFFVYKATRTELEGNWGLVAFISVWPVAAAWYQTVRNSAFWRWSTIAAFAPPAICVVGLALLILSPIPLLPIKADRLNRQRGRWQMAQQLAQRIESHGESLPTFTPTYQMTALLRFWGIDAHQEATFRASHYTFPPEHLGEVPAAYVVTDRPLPPDQIAGFAPPMRIGTFPTVVRGNTVHEYELWRYRRRAEFTASQRMLPAQRR